MSKEVRIAGQSTRSPKVLPAFSWLMSTSGPKLMRLSLERADHPALTVTQLGSGLLLPCLPAEDPLIDSTWALQSPTAGTVM